ncbi:hypothetical protein, conserved [Eimeria maxima]|uniref:Uncharacterized protein n=1 Tax=Eimeria maxima TaxID=5804 RepID=U6M9P2_EIMMA|nr:hypothetical protein, conserved [Eimeria maxima]CDJ59199.1 hypothetical protein, conserved [Eimeria maxima]
MKLIAIFVCRCPAGSDSVVFLSAAYDLSSFSFYQRNTVKEGLKFVTRTAIPRLPVGSQQEVEHEGSCAFVYRYPDSLAVLANPLEMDKLLQAQQKADAAQAVAQ